MFLVRGTLIDNLFLILKEDPDYLMKNATKEAKYIINKNSIYINNKRLYI